MNYTHEAIRLRRVQGASVGEVTSRFRLPANIAQEICEAIDAAEGIDPRIAALRDALAEFDRITAKHEKRPKAPAINPLQDLSKELR